MRTILLADDEANLRTLVRTTLEDPLHRILEASDGESVLAMARESHPDLVLLDWMMPGLTGIEVVRALRADPTTAEIPVLMLTARGQEKDREQAHALGVQGYLVKPFSPLELLERVHEILQAARAAQSALERAVRSAGEEPVRVSDIERRLEETDSQLAYYARDLRRAVEAERQRARELAEANARLEILNRLKTDFVVFISHELRTPLHAMSMVGLLDPRGDLQEQSEAIDVVRHGYERLNRFIAEGLRYFEWLATEKVHVDHTIDVGSLVQRIAAEISAARGPGVQIQVFAPAEPCTVCGKEDAIAEVARTLLDNAVKFSPRDKHVRVDVAIAEDVVVLAVTDRGVGLKPEMTRELFNPFTVADVAHHSSGTGLSLALSKAIVDAHGGSIRAESAGAGKGATFTVELPLAIAAVAMPAGRA